MNEILLPDGDRLILHDLGADTAERGAVVRLHRTGRRRWIARPPEDAAQDAFVSMRFEDGVLLADGFQGLRFRIDLKTGAVTTDAFVK